MKKTLNRVLAATLGMLVWTAPVAAHGPAPAGQPMELEPLLKAFGWDFDNAEITTEVLADGLYVLFGVGGNILISSGDDGVLMVDDQFPQMIPKIRKAMRSQGDREVDFIINTHWHFDHADGNQTLGKAKGNWIVSQSNSRDMLLSDQDIGLGGMIYEQKAYPAHALPDITFDDSMQFHLNGQRIDLLHFGPAHTTGDAIVILRGSNAVHLGDVFNNSGYPFIDAANGGSIDGFIKTCEAVLAEIDGDTIVVPGHGPVTNYAGLQNYVYMLKTVRGEIVAMIDKGLTREQILDSGVTATWDKAMGDPASFLDRAYHSLTHRYIP